MGVRFPLRAPINSCEVPRGESSQDCELTTLRSETLQQAQVSSGAPVVWLWIRHPGDPNPPGEQIAAAYDTAYPLSGRRSRAALPTASSLTLPVNITHRPKSGIGSELWNQPIQIPVERIDSFLLDLCCFGRRFVAAPSN